MTRRGYEGIAVAVPVTVPYQRFSTQGAPWFLGQVLAALVKQAGIAKDDIDGLCVSSFSLSPDTAVGLTQHLGVSPRWLDHIPMGGASGVVAVRRAARAVQAGDADIVACISGDTNHVDSFWQMLGSFSGFARDATWPYGSGGPNSMFAFITAHQMRTTGAKREDFGRICVAQRDNALGISHAMFRKPLTLDDYMNARVIADPIHLFDCVMPCAGGDGVLVMSEQRARDLGLPYSQVLAATERHNAYRDDPIMFRGGWAVDRDELFGMAGIKPEALDFVQFYDDYPVIVMMQYEGHGLCGEGEGVDFVRSHTLTVDGTLPTNTSGGQLSMGQAGAAGGYLGLVEAVRQLTDSPLGKPVPDAEVGLVSGFGMITYDRCLCTGGLILARA
ncbi:thiolase family protein [Piscinibacter sakaiensis]|uniref:thiolase family protein n=1 Tax=Piscinibacter sakaiensis TaxID=1547922 RepID=UPI003AAF535A